MASKSLRYSSHTRFEFVEIHFSWTLENFSACDQKNMEMLQSESFPALGEKKNQWCLRLYPHGNRNETKDYISLFVKYIPKESDLVEAQYKFNIQNSKGVLFNSKEYSLKDFGNEHPSWGCSRFAKRDEVMNYLVDDVLIVKCSIKMKLEVVTTSSGRMELDETEFQNNLISNLNQLKNSGSFSDVMLVANDGTGLPAHKFMLTARSPVFAAMFQHKMRESQDPTVTIEDVDGDTLKHLLHFIYTSKVDVPNCVMESLLTAADKYDIEDLKVLCEHQLVGKLEIENVAEYVILADLHNSEILKERSLKFIKENLNNVLETTGMKQLSTTRPSLFYDIIKAVSNKK